MPAAGCSACGEVSQSRCKRAGYGQAAPPSALPSGCDWPVWCVCCGGASIVSLLQLVKALERVEFPVAAYPPPVMFAWAFAGHLYDLWLWKALDKPLLGVRSHPSRDLVPMMPLAIGPIPLRSTRYHIMVVRT